MQFTFYLVLTTYNQVGKTISHLQSEIQDKT